MDVLPAPVPSELTAPYWEAAARGVLALQRCVQCRRFVHLPEYRCPFCRSGALEFEPVEPHGVIAALTVVHRALVPGASPPYLLAWVELAQQEALRVFGAVEPDLSGPRPAVGTSVEVVFRTHAGFGPVPVIRPRAGAGTR